MGGRFNKGRTNGHDDTQAGQRTGMSELDNSSQEKNLQQRRFAIDEIDQKFKQLSRSVVYQILT